MLHGGRYIRTHRRSKYKRRYSVKTAAAISAVVIVVIIMLMGGLFSAKRVAGFYESDVAAMRLSAQTMRSLNELSEKYAIDFTELLTVYCFEHDFFPNKSGDFLAADIEKDFILNYDTIKGQYNKRHIKQYSEMFDAILSSLGCLPTSGMRDKNGDTLYIYGDNWLETLHGKGMPGIDIYDRDNVDGRLPVLSVGAGYITRVGHYNPSGFTVDVTTDSGVTFTYSGLNNIESGLNKGASVHASQLLGTMGTSGKNYEAKERTLLRFSINPGEFMFGKDFYINPYPFLVLHERENYIY